MTDQTGAVGDRKRLGKQLPIGRGSLRAFSLQDVAVRVPRTTSVIIPDMRDVNNTRRGQTLCE